MVISDVLEKIDGKITENVGCAGHINGKMAENGGNIRCIRAN